MYRPLLALLALASPLHAQQDIVASPDLAVFEYGMICFYPEADPDTPLTDAEADVIADTGAVYDIIRTTETLTIPAIDGVTFGIVASVSTGNAVDINTTLTRTDPGGVVIAEVFPLTIDDGPTIDGWNLDLADGPLEGTYRFEGRRGDQLLYDLSFDVVAAEAYSGILPDCVPAS